MDFLLKLIPYCEEGNAPYRPKACYLRAEKGRALTSDSRGREANDLPRFQGSRPAGSLCLPRPCPSQETLVRCSWAFGGGEGDLIVSNSSGFQASDSEAYGSWNYVMGPRQGFRGLTQLHGVGGRGDVPPCLQCWVSGHGGQSHPTVWACRCVPP